MRPQDAISRIDDVLNSDYHYDESLGYQLTSDDFEWLETAKQSLEKQKPKKPIITIDGFFNGQPIYDTWGCPNCGKVYETDFEDYEYCPTCGQALDWEI